jgi:hypothetical protein
LVHFIYRSRRRDADGRTGCRGIDLFKIAGRSISGWVPSLKTGTSSHVRQPFCSQLEERLLLWLEYTPRCGQDMVFWENPPRVSMDVPTKRGTQLFYS